MNISLTPELEKYVYDKVGSDRYLSASEVVQEALQLLEAQDRCREAQIDASHKTIAIGDKQIDRGEDWNGKTLINSSQTIAQAILDQVPAIICADNLEGYCIYVNARYNKVFRLSSGQRVGRHLQELFSPERAEILLQQNQIVFAAEQVMVFEEDVPFPDGLHTHVKVKFPLKNARGMIYAVGTLFLDIAERKQAEKQLQSFTQKLQEQNEQLEEVSRLKSEFLSNISHELRTPLTSILGFTSVLLEQFLGPLTPKQSEYLALIRTSGAHLLDLINTLLDLSKIEAGEMGLNLAEVNLTEICQEALQKMDIKIQEKRQKVSLALPVARERIIVDRERAIQMLLNYLSNAVKFTPEGGSIVLSTRLASTLEMKEQNLSAEAMDRVSDFLVLSVSDTGIGVPVEKQHLLFQLFQQVDGSINRRYEGSGLGLALTRLLAELHGGAVSFKPASGQGSIFSIWLPLFEVANC
ncbi:MAG: ATP-binding protein [Pseudanabaenales cyanobacterium]|nr:ATP-binding protein [Pseudanabaenales cyanobacterium]